MVSDDKIKQAAELSQVAYKDEDTIKKYAQDHGYDSATVIRDKDGKIEAVVFKKGDEATVAFPGTKDKGDVETNLNAGTTDLGGGKKVHKGFNDALDKKTQGSDKTVMQRIEEETAGKKTTFVGHSKGGAEANLAAERHNGKSEVVTFGAPPVGNQAFVDSLEKKADVVRVTRKDDPIPLLKADPSLTHAGKEKPVGDSGVTTEAVKDVLKILQDPKKVQEIVSNPEKAKEFAGKLWDAVKVTHSVDTYGKDVGGNMLPPEQGKNMPGPLQNTQLTGGVAAIASLVAANPALGAALAAATIGITNAIKTHNETTKDAPIQPGAATVGTGPVTPAAAGAPPPPAQGQAAGK